MGDRESWKSCNISPVDVESWAQRAWTMQARIAEPRCSLVGCICQDVDLRKHSRILVVRHAQIDNLTHCIVRVGPLWIVGRRVWLYCRQSAYIAIDRHIERKIRVRGIERR